MWILLENDPILFQHLSKVMAIATNIAVKMELPNETLEVVRRGALLHDIGKLQIPHNLLYKLGKLDNQEWELLKLHPILGANILKTYFSKANLTGFNEIVQAVYYHHERYDGHGYPDGLRGSDIPLAARIITLADAYDAMTTDRPYRQALTKEAAIREIIQCIETQFDPEIVSAFLDIEYLI